LEPFGKKSNLSKNYGGLRDTLSHLAALPHLLQVESLKAASQVCAEGALVLPGAVHPKSHFEQHSALQSTTYMHASRLLCVCLQMLDFFSRFANMRLKITWQVYISMVPLQWEQCIKEAILLPRALFTTYSGYKTTVEIVCWLFEI
jgi:hypothetical protein